MVVEFILSALICLTISLILVVNIIHKYHKNKITKLNLLVSFIAFGYLAIGIFSILWSLQNLMYSRIDFSLIFSIVILVQTLILFKAYNLTNKIRNINYYLFFYLAIIFSAYISLKYISLQILIISFLLTLILSINLGSVSPSYRKVANVGIMYSSISLIFQFLVFFNIVRPFISSLVSNAIFLVFIVSLITQIEVNPIKNENNVKREDSYPILFIKYFIYIIVITNLVLISTVGVHEFSHVLAARIQGCESRSIIYEENYYPYTEIVCPNGSIDYLITLAGPLVPLIIGILLFILGEEFIRSLSLLVIGFNLIASYRDLQEVGLSQNLSFGVGVVGIVFLTIGLILLARHGIKNKATDTEKLI